MIERGEIGERLYHFRARYAQDWLADPDSPFVWRLQSNVAGTGALGDLGAHIIDLARYLVGQVTEVSADSRTFVARRSGKRVDVDDAIGAIGRFRNGAMLTLEATRFARGRKNQLTFEINGSAGSLVFDLENQTGVDSMGILARQLSDSLRVAVAKRAVVKMIEQNRVPTHTELEAKLFGADPL